MSVLSITVAGQLRNCRTPWCNEMPRTGIPLFIPKNSGHLYRLCKRTIERETGLEPATSSLGSWHSTTELLPRLIFLRSGDELQIEKCLYVAELSMIHGDTLNQNDIKKSRTFYTVSLGLFTEALKEDITLYSAELQASIDYVRSQLGENDLPPELVSNLHADTLRESIVPSDHPNTLYRQCGC
jgi:hypothetical protein